MCPRPHPSARTQASVSDLNSLSRKNTTTQGTMQLLAPAKSQSRRRTITLNKDFCRSPFLDWWRISLCGFSDCSYSDGVNFGNKLFFARNKKQNAPDIAGVQIQHTNAKHSAPCDSCQCISQSVGVYLTQCQSHLIPGKC